MNKKTLSLIFGFSLIFLMIITNISVKGDNTSYLFSVRSQKTISLTGSYSEYTDATSVTVKSNDPLFLIKEVLIKNSDSNLNIAVRVEPSEIDEDGVIILMDTNNDKVRPDDGKILKRNDDIQDGYFTQNSDFSFQDSPTFSGRESSFSYIDGSSQRLYEFKIPFSASEPTKDLYVVDPDNFIFGLEVFLQINGTYRSWSGVVSTNLPSSSENFSNLILAGPGKFLVPDFQPPAVTATSSAQDTNYTYKTESNYTYDSAAGSAPGFESIMFILAFIVIGSYSIIFRRFKH